VVILGLAAANCGSLQRNPVPLIRMEEAVVLEQKEIRTWIGSPSVHFQRDILQSVRDEPAGYFPREPDGAIAYHALALSGGGADGAFGAGVLSGWTESGTRPNFKIVTGISTGALIAPFAFLGPDFDVVLKQFYTGITTDEILKKRGLIGALRGESLADPTPLIALIESLVDKDFLKAVGQEHARGKRLYIGTTHLDADRLVIWNMGAIARSGHPDALKLFRSVMLASASIPGAFPPVYIDVEINGQRYDEMHVDGGVKAQVFVYEALLNMSAAVRTLGGGDALKDRSSIFLLRNGKLEPEPEQVQRKTIRIAGRAVSSMIKSSAANDLFRIYTFARRDGIAFFYAGLPPEIKIVSTEPFDQKAMTQLFEIGYDLALAGSVWRSDIVIPGLD